MIERTERDILRAYRVYKSSDIIRNRVDGEEDSEIYVVVCAFVALYNGITMSELQKVLPLSKNFITGLFLFSLSSIISTFQKHLVRRREQ